MERYKPRKPIAPWTYLRNLRIDKGLTIAEAAAEISEIRPIARNTLNQIELGWVGPGVKVLAALAKYYGLKPTELNATRPPLPSRSGEWAIYQSRCAARDAASTDVAA